MHVPIEYSSSLEEDVQLGGAARCFADTRVVYSGALMQLQRIASLFILSYVLQTVLGFASPELIKVCEAFQAAQVAMNASAAAGLFTKNGTTNIPVGTAPTIGQVW